MSTTEDRTSKIPIPFGRKIIVGMSKKDYSDTLRFVADGSTDNFKISFHIERQLVAAYNEGTISLWNLRPETTEELMKGGNVTIDLYVSVGNQQPVLLASGPLVRAEPVLELPEVKTVLYIRNLYNELSNAVATPKSFLENTPIVNIIKYLLDKRFVPNVKYTDADLATISTLRIGANGWSMKERVADCLTDLGSCYNFSWTIQNNVFQAVADDKSIDTPNKNVPEISLEANNLFNAKPLMQEVIDTAYLKGVQIEAYLDPNIKVAQLIYLKSHILPSDYNTYYKVHTATFDGESHGNNWKMSLECKTLPKAR